MSKTVRLRKGLDIRLIGAASKVRTEAQVPKTVSIRPADFHGMTPKMLLKEGEQVKIGDIVFQDKYSDTIKYASPVNGTLKAIVRGAKRKIEEIVISADATQDFDGGTPIDYASLSGEEVKSTMLAAGLWPFVRQRPLDVVADPKNEPKAIFVSAFDSSPLAPDFDFVVHGKEKEFQAGLKNRDRY